MEDWWQARIVKWENLMEGRNIDAHDVDSTTGEIPTRGEVEAALGWTVEEPSRLIWIVGIVNGKMSIALLVKVLGVRNYYMIEVGEAGEVEGSGLVVFEGLAEPSGDRGLA